MEYVQGENLAKEYLPKYEEGEIEKIKNWLKTNEEMQTTIINGYQEAKWLAEHYQMLANYWANNFAKIKTEEEEKRKELKDMKRKLTIKLNNKNNKRKCNDTEYVKNKKNKK
ncbi:hypothetical protein BCR32DRAFT_250934 [Anaeromyces robustus]|uniref:Uncharacterized protein n=1 Tax=Anaeromyces robustus TaxID=1754192 RepID=A0A1Y1VUD5_9FUNG|nr:hypothetical protein BCR32DRAFT_250934 [Anaeromyces robustus]|eukprot:ORX64803.1 hypothetical protein BCR32DRAFT_250934 [Anaeromyces robustus]